ncbi:MAG: PEGA domain protein [Candidatus Beckwithbacteria bacterium GW2011_GWB1_47_15]|uniref:PEGA domain protein n=1 Tax=Candidatus Beckwithbacteria bacterium GW2011_GWB1_47_15 TaxID=1618371 RepID=A0A0G1RWX5_9BACT|nr:MAG: WD40-domain containing protein [Candidatus Beckwithbacteria bacterium GW2011_GWC1_49_16]AQS30672.1 hypothetical protein [uncultured bacterium]KKU35860.1 MAG: PEGA domain protein [Candidatus Beckwithbacteria bacterium GW2011_GWA1_46_30]KKU61824.1 MAG: PEGA domain protein [Candidatus Beckwithbacteria bacterium GW2011_GWB1_47_15]KKU72622.1 MAG: PEGA domain protein [Candidatus Beckwithbacteria bacterium GW2011_GWA2_47_25]KKW04210.1 MAG: PEGA domain protein [Candidatus Beckwithbacteria bact
MKRFAWVLIILLIGGAIFGVRSLLSSRKKAALSVEASPKATVFLDGEHLGQTPYYNEKLKPGEYVLKIVPESSGQALTVWEGRVNLTPGILTVVKRELGLTEEESSGEILSFEALADKNATSIAVVTTPDGAVVNLDGEPRGFAPLSIDSVSEGDHVLVVSSPGYRERSIKAKTVKGYKLIASVQLAREGDTVSGAEDDQEATPSAQVSPSPSPKASPSPKTTASPKASPTSGAGDPDLPYVVIDNEADGYVNCRSEPSTGGGDETIVAALDHGDKFPLLDEQSGWYQVEYESGKSCWITGKYAEKYE